MVDLVAFGIILDDLVFPNGETSMGVLGGGGPQAAFGMRLGGADLQVGLFSGVGTDLPAEARAWLEKLGLDLTGLRVSPYPTARAWQVIEEDGLRRQVFRVPAQVVESQLDRSVEQLPDAYRRARGFHLGVHPNQPELEFIAGLHGLGSTISMEVFKEADQALTSDELEALLGAADIFSTNLGEARTLVGDGKPVELAHRLCTAGAKILTLRLGPEGSLLMDAHQKLPIHIPAVPVPAVDPVGAGNAYCGAFLASWIQSGDLLQAGRQAGVAASFLVEQVGLPDLDRDLPAEAQRRLHWLEANT